MQRGIRTFASTRRGPNPLVGCFFTSLWVLAAMAGLSVGSFFLARDYIAENFLEPSKIHTDRPHPVRVLTPDEAAAIARDEDSRVWTEGVRKEDIPKLPPTERPRRSRRSKPDQPVKTGDENGSRETTPPATKSESTPATPAPAAPPPPADTGGTPTVDD
ncbi:MAG: hypothetical protein ACYC7E_23115 [Armatimonadota bacterium]